MSARKYITIWCDGPYCYVWTGSDKSLVNDARRDARRLGWATALPTPVPNRTADLCPSCVERAGGSSVHASQLLERLTWTPPRHEIRYACSPHEGRDHDQHCPFTVSMSARVAEED